MPDVDVLVIGGGVTGLASALALAEGGRSVALLDPHPRFGAETSTHNSGVIHAGIYYPRGSLKHTLCIEGNALLSDEHVLAHLPEPFPIVAPPGPAERERA